MQIFLFLALLGRFMIHNVFVHECSIDSEPLFSLFSDESGATYFWGTLGAWKTWICCWTEMTPSLDAKIASSASGGVGILDGVNTGNQVRSGSKGEGGWFLAAHLGQNPCTSLGCIILGRVLVVT